MTFEDLKKVNAEIKTTNIKGKDYAEVPQRVEAFRKLHPDGCIATDCTLEGNLCIAKTIVKDSTGRVLATGTAYEVKDSSYINKTSFIENAETSAVGRALGFAGIGSAASIASADEVKHAIELQELDKKKNHKISDIDAKSLHDRCGGNKGLEEYMLNGLGAKRWEDLTYEVYRQAVVNWDKYAKGYNG